MCVCMINHTTRSARKIMLFLETRAMLIIAFCSQPSLHLENPVFPQTDGVRIIAQLWSAWNRHIG